jgi:hypothetical protein
MSEQSGYAFYSLGDKGMKEKIATAKIEFFS